MKRTLALILALLMTLVVFASCNNTNQPEVTTPAGTKAPSDPATTPTTKPSTNPETKPATKPAETKPATEPATEAPEIPVPTIQDGIMVFHQDFDTFPNTTGNDEVAKLLGWQIRNKDNGTLPTGEPDAALTDNTTVYSIEDGKLKLVNNTDDGKDSYFKMVGDDYMKPAAVGNYTIQYDLRYIESSKPDRYICILANYNGYDTYNSFHLRASAYANNQVRFIGSWYTYDVAGDFYAAGNDTDKGSSIGNKLWGLTYDKNEAPLMGKDITVRYQATPEGPVVWLRDNGAANPEFVCISKPDASGTASGYWGLIENYALCLKTGGKMNGYVDNISVWTGLGDEPIDTTTTAYETAIASYLEQVKKAAQ